MRSVFWTDDDSATGDGFGDGAAGRSLLPAASAGAGAFACAGGRFAADSSVALPIIGAGAAKFATRRGTAAYASAIGPIGRDDSAGVTDAADIAAGTNAERLGAKANVDGRFSCPSLLAAGPFVNPFVNPFADSFVQSFVNSFVQPFA